MALIATIHGERDDTGLTRAAGRTETDNEVVDWVEYRDPDTDELLHRSLHITLKRGLSLTAETGSL